MPTALKNLHARHRDVIRLHLLGWKNFDIANEIGITTATVCNVLGSPMGKMVISDMQRQLDEEAMEVSAQLVQNAKHSELFLGRIARGEEEVNHSLRAKVCMDQLDRAGFPKVTKNVSMDLHGAITAEEIAEIKDEARRWANAIPVESSADTPTGDPPPPELDVSHRIEGSTARAETIGSTVPRPPETGEASLEVRDDS